MGGKRGTGRREATTMNKDNIICPSSSSSGCDDTNKVTTRKSNNVVGSNDTKEKNYVDNADSIKIKKKFYRPNTEQQNSPQRSFYVSEEHFLNVMSDKKLATTSNGITNINKLFMEEKNKH